MYAIQITIIINKTSHYYERKNNFLNRVHSPNSPKKLVSIPRSESVLRALKSTVLLLFWSADAY